MTFSLTENRMASRGYFIILGNFLESFGINLADRKKRFQFFPMDLIIDLCGKFVERSDVGLQEDRLSSSNPLMNF